MTRDIDLVMEIHSGDVLRLAQELGDAYYFDEDMALDAIAREGMFNLLHQESMIKIDCIVRKHHAYANKDYHRRDAEGAEENTKIFSRRALRLCGASIRQQLIQDRFNLDDERRGLVIVETGLAQRHALGDAIQRHCQPDSLGA